MALIPPSAVAFSLSRNDRRMLASAMVRTRIVLALAFLAATFMATTTLPEPGYAKPSDCADSVCEDVAANDVCPGCKGEKDRAIDGAAAACAMVCAVMNAVLPVPAQIPPPSFPNDGFAAYPAANGGTVAPERAPPRPSIPA